MSEKSLGSDQRERRKQVKLRLRDDLVIVPQEYDGATFHVIKDPAGLVYFHFDQYDHFLLQLLDGSRTIEEVQQQFEQHFRPRRLSHEELEAFGQRLVQSGIAYFDLPQAGQHLYDRHRKRRWKKVFQVLTNILYITIPLWDPDPMLIRLSGWLRWVFTTAATACAVMLMLSALLLVGSHFESFQAKLPSYQEFFSLKNLLYLWLATGIVKILHEFGHGVACKHYGGEVHDMGLLFMCLSPCLYLNVSDAWRFPDKWKRIAVGVAGIYVELLIAAIATYIWWFSASRGVLYHLSLSMMVVCSVNTLLFNGNPLLRFDGYYVLADWLEIPNLRERANTYLKNLFLKQCLGMEVPPEPAMTLTRRILFVVFAIASYFYGWIVTFGAIWFVSGFLPPKLKPISVMLAWFSAATMVGWPLYHLGKGIYQRGKLPAMKTNRVAVTASVAIVLLLLFCFLPLPISRVRQQALVQLRPEAVQKVFAPVAGTLTELHVRDGQHVNKGDIIAVLRSQELEGELEEARTQHEARLVQLQALRQQAVETSDAQERNRLEVTLAQADGERKTFADQVAMLRKKMDLLKVQAPRSGVVLGAPRREEVGKLWEKDQAMPLCSIGDPTRLRSLAPVPPEEFRLLKEDLDPDGSLPATIRVQGWGGQTWQGVLAALPESEAKEVPLTLTTRCGGPLTARQGSQPDMQVPQSQHYLVAVDFMNAGQDGIWPGTLSQVKIHCKWRSGAWWLWRTINATFDLKLI